MPTTKKAKKVKPKRPRRPSTTYRIVWAVSVLARMHSTNAATRKNAIELSASEAFKESVLIAHNWAEQMKTYIASKKPY